MMKFLSRILLIILLVLGNVGARAQMGDLEYNGLAAKISSPLIYKNSQDELKLIIRIAKSSQVNLSIMDLTGKQVKMITTFAESGISEFNYPVSDLPAGLYIVSFRTPDVMITRRFILQ